MVAKVCLFVENRDSLVNYPSAVATELVKFALADFPDIALTILAARRPEELSQLIEGYLESADLVIADLTDMKDSVFYSIGARHKAGKPTILITSSDNRNLPFGVRRHMWVAYPHENPGDSRNLLSLEISRLMEDSPARPNTPFQPKDFAARIETIASAISELRINSLADHVQKLYAISTDLQKLEKEEVANEVHEITEAVLLVLAQIDQVVGSSRLGKLILSGALAALVTGGGLAAAAVFSLSIAVWKGPEYFRAALHKYLQGKKAAPAKSAASRTSVPKSSAPRGSRRSSRRSDDETDKAE